MNTLTHHHIYFQVSMEKILRSLHALSVEEGWNLASGIISEVIHPERLVGAGVYASLDSCGELVR